MITRPATLEDLDSLMRLEEQGFTGDRISRRQFRYLLARAHADTVVVTEATGGPARPALLGYALVLYRQGTSMARLYSIAVDAGARGRGIGAALVEACEAAARESDHAFLRLEIRTDNAASIALFERLGYRRFGHFDDYYEDGAGALRYQKSLAPHLAPADARVPYYRQTLDFTCGPAALMMAMASLDPSIVPDRRLELRLWREATTIFMTAGHGGCGPHGLALAAARRGFPVELYLSDDGTFLIDSVRSAEKKEVMRLVQRDMEDELAEREVPVVHQALSLDALQSRFEAGAVPLVFVSSYAILGERVPHWVVVTGFDAHFVHAHDPYVDAARHETALDSIDVPILRRRFEKMARYGRAGVRATLLVLPGSVERRIGMRAA
ncbi:MAG: GNAT family N-acetyltransferase/peptidase C39 family protein [Lautropia sp.]